MAPKIAIVYYSLYSHIRTLAHEVKRGVESAGGHVDIYQIPETLPETVLQKMHAPAKSNDPIADPTTLTKYDAFLFGIPTRYGNFPAQWKAFGTLLAVFGLKVLSTESTPVSLFLLVPLVEARKSLLSTLFQP